MKENYITLIFYDHSIIIRSSITGTELFVPLKNHELFNYLIKYQRSLPVVDTKGIIGKLNTGLPKGTKVYIKNKCRDIYYIIKDKIDDVSFLYLQAQLDDKFEESGVPVKEMNRCYYEFYSMTLGKELATLACVLDMPPEIACLLEEV